MSFNVLKIKSLMAEKNLTYDVLSDEVGITRQTLRNYLTEKSKVDVVTLEKIASFFGVSISYFFEDEPTQTLNEPQNVYNSKKKYIEQRIEDLEQRITKLEQKK